MDSRSQALCVRVGWGDQRLSTHLLGTDGTQRLSVGPQSDADIVAPASGRARFEVHGVEWRLVFTDGLRGALLHGHDAPRSLTDVIAGGHASELDGAWSLPIGADDAVRIDAGTLSITAFRVRAPKRAVATLDDVLDYRWLNTLLVCLLLSAIGVAEASFAHSSEADDDGVANRAPTWVRHVLVAPPPPEQTVAGAGANADTSATPAKKRPTPTASEGHSGRHHSHQAAGRPSTATPDPRVLAGVALAGLGAQGIFGSGGLGHELSGALGTMVGMNDSLRGLSLRGNGGNAPGGVLIGLGGVNTHGGRAYGQVQLCASDTCKTSVAPKVDEGEQHVCTADGPGACMDKELIRKVIRLHLGQVRYCYESLLNQYPGLTGRVSVGLHVSAEGTVDVARVAASSAQRPELGECLVSRARLWTFPTNKSLGGFTVTYPFVFRASGT